MSNEQLADLSAVLAEAASKGVATRIVVPKADPDEAALAARRRGTSRKSEADEHLERSRAMLYVATVANGGEDCHMLLDMLGLLGEAKTYATEPTQFDYGMRGNR